MTTIDIGTVDDLPALVDIHNHTAATSNSNFNTRSVSVAERRDWFDQHSATGPHRLLVARSSSALLGYACTSAYRDHEAFRETVEVSIALHESCRGQGIGTALYGHCSSASPRNRFTSPWPGSPFPTMLRSPSTASSGSRTWGCSASTQ